MNILKNYFSPLIGGFLVCSATGAETSSHVLSPDMVQSHVLRNGNHLIREIRNLVTGEVYVPGRDHQDNTRSTLTDVYDNLYANTAVWGGTPGRLNLQSIDPNTLAPVCTDDQPLHAPYLRFALSTGADGCEDLTQETGRHAGLMMPCTNGRAADIRGDDYQMEPSLVGAPDGMTTILRHRFLWTFSPQGPTQPGKRDRQVHRVLMIDHFDLDNDGCQQVTGGYSITVDWDPNGVRVPSAIYLFDVDLTPISGMEAFNTGTYIYDVDNFAYDNSGNPNPADPACGTLWEWARGYSSGAPCQPNQTYTVGNETAADLWFYGNLFNSKRFVPGDELLCDDLDPSAGCDDPNLLTYEDVWTDGMRVPLITETVLPGGATVTLSSNKIATFSADLGAAPCPGDCTGDGAVDLNDLLAVLTDFDAPTIGNCPGGLGGLLDVLSHFGAVCP